jgi:dephospho-CoA kinase
MKNIAITGSFASGKSFVLNIAKNLGYSVFSCDDFVKELYEDIKLQNQIVSEIDGFDKFYKKDLIKIIYDNPDVRKKVESIIHPLVRAGIKKFEDRNKSKELVFTEVPLLFEANFDKYFSYVICVFCSEETRILRAKERGVIDFDLYKKIKSAQMDQEEKIKRSDFVIDSQNNQSRIEQSLYQIIKIVRKIK